MRRMKSTIVLLLVATFAVACGSNDDTSADAPPIILDPADGGSNPGDPDAMVSNPGDPDAMVATDTCDVGSCESCAECSQSGPPGTCMDESAACGSSQACLDFYNCIAPCETNECVEACQTTYPEGSDLYIEFVACVLCNDCYVVCDGAGAGC